MKNRAVISGGWGYGNIGDNAILAAFLNSGADLLSGYELNFLSYDTDELMLNHGISSLPSVHRMMERYSILPRKIAKYVPNVRSDFNRVAKCAQFEIDLIKSADLLVLCGGGYFNGDWPSMSDSQYAMIEAARIGGAKTVILGQSVGPFSRRETVGELRRHLQMVDLIAVRDQMSYDICCEALGQSEKVHLTADLANLLPFKSSIEATDRRGKRLGLMVQFPRSKLGKIDLSKSRRRPSLETYFSDIVGAVAEFANIFGFDICVIPSTTWDRTACRVIEKLLLDRGVSVSYRQPSNVSDFISMCQNVDLMFSTNMHPLIIAATALRPLVALSYHFKTDHFMNEIGLEKYVLDIDCFSTVQLLSSLVSAWVESERISASMRERQVKLRELARKNFDLLQFLIAS